MSLALFHEVPAEAIQIIFDANKTLPLNRHMWGAFLGLPQNCKSLKSLDECEILASQELGAIQSNVLSLIWT